jgi:hypothetical protein
MTNEYRSLKPIAFNSLLNGRLRKFNIRVVHRYPSTLLTIAGQSVAVEPIANGQEILIHSLSDSSEAIISALEREFDTEIVGEEDPRFWGHEDKESYEASFGNTTPGLVVDLKPSGGVALRESDVEIIAGGKRFTVGCHSLITDEAKKVTLVLAVMAIDKAIGIELTRPGVQACLSSSEINQIDIHRASICEILIAAHRERAL